MTNRQKLAFTFVGALMAWVLFAVGTGALLLLITPLLR